MKLNISRTLLLIFVLSTFTLTIQSCKGTKKDCDCPTFGKQQKQKKTRYKIRK